MSLEIDMTFPTEESYEEAWIHMMDMGYGFSFNREKRYIISFEVEQWDIDYFNKIKDQANDQS